MTMNQTAPTQSSSSIPHSIPREITFQSCIMPSTEATELTRVICPQHFQEMTSMTYSQTVSNNDKSVESTFNGGVVSLTSENNLYNDLPEILPLDFRVGHATNDHESMEYDQYDISQNMSIFVNDKTCMEVDSSCESKNGWIMDSICGDSLDTEEDMDSIPEWINRGPEDFWNFSIAS